MRKICQADGCNTPFYNSHHNAKYCCKECKLAQKKIQNAASKERRSYPCSECGSLMFNVDNKKKACGKVADKDSCAYKRHLRLQTLWRYGNRNRVVTEYVESKQNIVYYQEPKVKACDMCNLKFKTKIIGDNKCPTCAEKIKAACKNAILYRPHLKCDDDSWLNQ